MSTDPTPVRIRQLHERIEPRVLKSSPVKRATTPEEHAR